jgi:hypothetical protein
LTTEPAIKSITEQKLMEPHPILIEKVVLQFLMMLKISDYENLSYGIKGQGGFVGSTLLKNWGMLVLCAHFVMCVLLWDFIKGFQGESKC